MPAPLSQDRLVAKEVSLGVIRESALLPEDHIGLRLIAPFQSVESDDVIFDYTIGLATGMAPARAEDSESELAQKDDTVGTGRASILDWALKDHYDPSDVSRYREIAQIESALAGAGSFPLVINSMRDGFQAKIDRDTLVRRRKLDNRLEWLIMTALESGGISYDDGKIVFSVDFGRPSDQTNGSVTFWSGTDADPISDALDVSQSMWERHRVRPKRAIMSTRIVQNILNSAKFAARANTAGSGNPELAIDPRYLIDGWGYEAALAVWARATGIQPIVYDSVYRTRVRGTTTMVNNPFLDDSKVIYLPGDADINAFDDAIGFAKTLTSPHPEGQWSSGYYEWEHDTGPDPWGYDRGNGIKAFPVFPHLEYTWVTKVLADA